MGKGGSEVALAASSLPDWLHYLMKAPFCQDLDAAHSHLGGVGRLEQKVR